MIKARPKIALLWKNSGQQEFEDYTRLIIDALLSINDNYIDIALAYPEDLQLSDDFESILKQYGIICNPIKWKLIPVDTVTRVQELSSYFKELCISSYLVPEDGMDNMHDCDLWLMMDEQLSISLAPIKKHGYIILGSIFDQLGTDRGISPMHQLCNADIIIAEGNVMKAEIARTFAINPAKIAVIPDDFASKIEVLL